MSKAFDKIKAGLDEALIVAPYLAEIERLTKERDEARVEARTYGHLSNARGSLLVVVQSERDALRALLREAGNGLSEVTDALAQCEEGPRIDDARALLARIAAATGETE